MIIFMLLLRSIGMDELIYDLLFYGTFLLKRKKLERSRLIFNPSVLQCMQSPTNSWVGLSVTDSRHPFFNFSPARSSQLLAN
jgi:hypothetical protein